MPKQVPEVPIQTPNFFLHPLATILGDNVQIGEGSVIGPFAVIYGNTKIGKFSYVGAHSVIGESPFDGQIDDTIGPTLIGDYVQIGANSVIQIGAIVYDGALIGHGTVLKPRLSLIRKFNLWRRRRVRWQTI